MCRSPYLEFVLRRRLPDIEISSAGFSGAGRPVPKHGRIVAAEHGIDLTTHQSRSLNQSMLRHANLVLVMDERQARYFVDTLRFSGDRVIIVGDLDPIAGESRAIRDPLGRSADAFESTFARLDRCAESLVSLLPPR
jgi:protein-tyrosine phosphatase